MLFVLLNSACLIIDVTDSSDSRNETVRGSGNLTKGLRDLPIFYSVEMTTAGKVTLTQGDDQQVSVIVNENLHEFINTTVCNGKLYIGTKRGTSLSNMALTVNLVMTDLEELVTSSAGSIESKNKFKADNVSLVLSSAGNIALELEAEQLHSQLLSAGNLYLSGSVKEHYATLASAGNLYAFNLITDKAKIMLSSAGNAQVFVSQVLDVTISSIGSLYYKGFPQIFQKITSKGKVINANG